MSFATAGFRDFRFEPRANIDIRVGPNHTLNLSYMETNQFSHLLATQGEIMRNEVWVPADQTIKPASSKQVAGGWRGVFNRGMFDVEVSAYYKTLTNIATYREGYTSIMGDELWRSKIEGGERAKRTALNSSYAKPKAIGQALWVTHGPGQPDGTSISTKAGRFPLSSNGRIPSR